MSQEIVAQAQSQGEIKINEEEVKAYIAPNASDSELYFFCSIAKAYGLNPFKREIHFVKYGNQPGQTIVGYETYIKRAERTGLLDGWSVGIDKDDVGEKAVLEIHRKDRNYSFRWEAYRKEFDKQQSTWKTMPFFMLKKVAISQGFRLAFPEEIGGMPYTPDEINAGTSEALCGASQSTQSAPEKNPEQPTGSSSASSTADTQPTKAQFQKLGVLANELFATREERLYRLNAWLSNEGHNEVSSASELSRDQVSDFIQALEDMREDQSPKEELYVDSDQ